MQTTYSRRWKVRFSDEGTQWVVGRLATVYEESNEVVSCKSPAINVEALLDNPDIVKQPPSFFRRSLLERMGGWNPSFFMAMDFDLWIRLSQVAPPKMVDSEWAYFRVHGQQKTSSGNMWRQFRELIFIMRRERATPVQLARLRLRRLYVYGKQVLKSLLIKSGVLSRRYAARPVHVRRNR